MNVMEDTMSNAGYAGKYPDHVCRYNRRQTEWLDGPGNARKPIRQINVDGWFTTIFFATCLAGAIAILTVILQAA